MDRTINHAPVRTPTDDACPVTNPDCGTGSSKLAPTDGSTSEELSAPSQDAPPPPSRKKALWNVITSIFGFATARRAQSGP
jgi:hypothetical protein